VVQECLNNISKHANATHVSIQIECTEKSVLLRIKDDGKGFDVSTLHDIDRKGESGFGIVGMRERIELLEGDFIIDSAINIGTTVRVRLPYESQGGI
jgi:two-component system sensor histidine kinase DegS